MHSRPHDDELGLELGVDAILEVVRRETMTAQISFRL